MHRPFDDGIDVLEMALLLTASDELAQEERERIMLEQQEEDDGLDLDDE